MTIAGFEIIACPHCSQLFRNRIIGSYNTFNSRQYSDGYVEGDGIPVLPSVIKCVNNNCGKFFNVTEAEIIAEIDTKSFDAPEWKGAYYLSGNKIGVKELEEALGTDFCNNQDNEIKTRNLLHRRYNDIFRKDRKYKLSQGENDALIHNIERLIEFFKNDTSTSGKIYLAELYREKSDFNICLQILAEINNENEYEKLVKEKIYSQAKVKDDKVFVI